MVRGKAWSADEEKQLRQLLAEGKSIRVVARTLDKTRDCVRMKVARLGLDVVVQKKTDVSARTTTTDDLPLPKELPSVEEALLILAGALEASKSKGLDKVEVRRLAVVARLAQTYERILANYVNYRAIEAKVAEMEEKYERLLGEKAKGMASPKDDGKGSAPAVS